MPVSPGPVALNRRPFSGLKTKTAELFSPAAKNDTAKIFGYAAFFISFGPTATTLLSLT